MRNIFRITSKLQRRYMRLLELSLIIPTVVVGGCLYYLVLYLIAEQIAIPEFIAAILFPALRKINIILLVTLPVVFILLFCWGVALSHRLAGPIERLTRDLEKIAGGDYKKRLRIRKDDELKPAIDSINKILDKIGERQD